VHRADDTKIPGASLIARVPNDDVVYVYRVRGEVQERA